MARIYKASGGLNGSAWSFGKRVQAYIKRGLFIYLFFIFILNHGGLLIPYFIWCVTINTVPLILWYVYRKRGKRSMVSMEIRILFGSKQFKIYVYILSQFNCTWKLIHFTRLSVCSLITENSIIQSFLA